MGNEYIPTEEVKAAFLKHSEGLQLQILKEDGVYRHLMLRRPGTSIMSFQIVTWPGHLMIFGDAVCSYCFTRLKDMFEFFRGNYERKDWLSINESYWAEKLISVDHREPEKEYCPEYMEEQIKDRFESYWDEESDQEEKKACWARIEEDILPTISDEHACRAAIEEFDHGEFRFYDFWEAPTDAHTSAYRYALFAIVWAIRQYDDHKDAENAKEAQAITHEVSASPPHDYAEVLERVRNRIVSNFDVKPEEVTESANLITDLGADSLDVVELEMYLAEDFGMDIDLFDTPENSNTTVGHYVSFIWGQLKKDAAA